MPKGFGYDPQFSGSDYEEKFDRARLTGQILRIYDLMKDQRWRTLAEIESDTRDPSASISAQLRNLRKESFGAHTVEKRPRGDRSNGLFEYRVITKRQMGHGNIENVSGKSGS